MNNNNPISFFNSDLDFESYLSEIITLAGKNDEGLSAARRRVSECKNRIPKLTKVLDLENPAELTLDECKVLIEYLLANNRLAVVRMDFFLHCCFHLTRTGLSALRRNRHPIDHTK